MKNKKLWLTLIITIGIVFLLTWVIPSTSYGNGSELALGVVNPTGFWDVFYYLSMLPLWFGQNFIYILIVAIFYGVINYTGALRILEEKIVKFFKKKEKIFLLISSSLFIIVTSLTGINFPLMVFVPFIIGIVLLLGFNKITALITTVVSILVGTMGSLYSAVLYSALSNYMDNGIAYGWYKLGLILAGLVIVNLYLYFTSNIAKGKNKEQFDEEMLFIAKEGQKKVKVWPLVTSFIILLVLLIIGMTPWSEAYNITIFEKIHQAIGSVKIGNFAIIKNIIGSSAAAFGAWDIFDMAALIGILTVAMIFAYKIKWQEAFKAAIDGITKMLPVAILVLLSNMTFVFVSQTGILTTIINFFASLTEGINVFAYSIASFIGGALVNESYVASNVTWVFNSILSGSADLPLLLLIQQVMYGLAMLVAPTSIFLLAGLSYLEVDYTKWLKKTWLLLIILATLGLMVLTLAIAL
ncbi:MAG TPA: hypothetical protein GXZ95_03820 [Mollicutes bacterium]|nr:hypothetical protein [Mollicutes bacterium]